MLKSVGTVTMSTCGFVAFCSTVYRLWVRRDRLWVDDAWVAFALTQLIIQFVAVFMHVPLPNSLTKTDRVAAYCKLSTQKSLRHSLYLSDLMAMTFYSIIWSVIGYFLWFCIIQPFSFSTGLLAYPSCSVSYELIRRSRGVDVYIGWPAPSSWRFCFYLRSFYGSVSRSRNGKIVQTRNVSYPVKWLFVSSLVSRDDSIWFVSC